MRVLVLWADGRSANLGVRALAEGSAALVSSIWPSADVAFHHHRTAMPVTSARQVLKERVTRGHAAVRWLRQFDLVLDTRSGDSFTDIYGPRRLQNMTAFAHLVSRSGVPYVLGPQTVGPFSSRLGHALARYTLGRAAAVLVRDSVSRDVCTQLGRSADALTTDVVFALPVPTASVSRDVLLNVSGLLWSGGVHVDAAAYREVVREVYARLTAEGRRVSLLAHVLDSPGADNDVPAVHELAQTCSPAPEVIVPSSLDEARAAVASATVVVGSRMHACLNALSVGTPAVALAYSRKFAPLLTDLGWKHTVDLRHDPAPARNACAAVEAAQTSGDVAAVGARASERLQSARTVLAALATPVAMHR